MAGFMKISWRGDEKRDEASIQALGDCDRLARKRPTRRSGTASSTGHCDFAPSQPSKVKRFRPARRADHRRVEHAAALPHAPHRRRQAPSHIAAGDTGRAFSSSHLLVQVGEHVVLRRRRRLGGPRTPSSAHGCMSAAHAAAPGRCRSASAPGRCPAYFRQLLLAREAGTACRPTPRASPPAPSPPQATRTASRPSRALARLDQPARISPGLLGGQVVPSAAIQVLADVRVVRQPLISSFS